MLLAAPVTKSLVLSSVGRPDVVFFLQHARQENAGRMPEGRAPGGPRQESPEHLLLPRQ